MVLLYFLFTGIILGFAGSISIFDSVRVSVLDVAVGVIALSVILKLKTTLQVIKKDKTYKIFLTFCVIGLISLGIKSFSLTLIQQVISFTYLLRLFTYSLIYPYILVLKREKRLNISSLIHLFVLSGVILAIIGVGQYFLYPDLRNLEYLGWDPHYKRIFSTFFDPNFLGIYLVLSLSVLVNAHYKVITRLKYEREVLGFILAAVTFFTYSRGAILLLVILGVAILIRKNKAVLIIPAIIILIVILSILPRPGGEGVRLERLFSIQQRLDHARLGLTIFANNPILGVGFNTLRYVKSSMGNSDNWMVSHAGAGLDISLLTVLTTTGLIGAFVFLYFIYLLYAHLPKNMRLSLLILIISSFFVNSLFFTPLSAFLFLLASFY